MARTLRGVMYPQRSRLILSAWLALSTCFRKIMWPTNTFSFCIAKTLRTFRLGRSNSPRRASITRLQRA
jgi:hypothetical protein